MTAPPRLRAVPPSPSPSSTETRCGYCGQVDGHSKRCSVTKFDAPELRVALDREGPLRHTLLYAEAERFATDWMTPLRNQAMDIQGHALELCHMAGWVGRYVADAQMTAGERPLRKAREDLHRVVGLCAVLHDLLTELEHDAPPVNA